MDYLPEEIEFVKFCANQEDTVICTTKERGRKRKDCPAFKSCDENNPPCSRISTKMEKSEELAEEYTNIIKFWLEDVKWDEENCIPKGGGEPCPNHEKNDCAKGETICERLLRKLGVYEPYAYTILETEINKIIRHDLPNIDFGFDEKLSLIDSEISIAEINGRVDLLLKSEKSNLLIVVELKAVEASREHVGQLASYVGWYKEHPLEGCKDVKGILLAPKFSKGAESALKACNNLYKRCFDLHVEIIKPVEHADNQV